MHSQQTKQIKRMKAKYRSESIHNGLNGGEVYLADS